MIRMKMRDEYREVGQRDFSLRESNGRASSDVENQLLFTSLDQCRRAELIRIWLWATSAEESDTYGLSTRDISGN